MASATTARRSGYQHAGVSSRSSTNVAVPSLRTPEGPAELHNHISMTEGVRSSKILYSENSDGDLANDKSRGYCNLPIADKVGAFSRNAKVALHHTDLQPRPTSWWFFPLTWTGYLHLRTSLLSEKISEESRHPVDAFLHRLAVVPAFSGLRLQLLLSVFSCPR